MLRGTLRFQILFQEDSSCIFPKCDCNGMPKDQYNELQEGVAVRFLLYSPNGIAHIRGRSQRLLQVKKWKSLENILKLRTF